MSWNKIIENNIVIWECSSYANLQYNEINNLARYGQPFSPYQAGFDYDLEPDYEKIIVRMSQIEVMYNGYGRLIKPEHFPVVKKFLRSHHGSIQNFNSQYKLNKYNLFNGRYSFNDLVLHGIAKESDKFISSNLYKGSESVPTTSGYGVSSGDAAYIHGTIGFALMSGTIFEIYDNSYVVHAEIGALDDNWNFQSGSTVAKLLNPLVATLFGPDYNNLEANKAKGEKFGRIEIQFRGEGKKMLAGGFQFPDYNSPYGVA